jgi:hypothetical protein
MLLRWIGAWRRHHRLTLLPGTRKRSPPAPSPGAPSQPTVSLESDDSRNGYVSDFTRFMEGFMKSHPEAEVEQRQGWSMYWNRKVEFDRLEEAAADAVPTDPYYYFATPPVDAADSAPPSDTAAGPASR